MPTDVISKFELLINPRERVSFGVYRMTAARRATLAFPKGTKVYDLNSNIWYFGDGSTGGGIAQDT